MDRSELEQWLAEGLSLEAIGRLVGRHPSTVSYWLQKYGLEPVHRRKHLARGPLPRVQLEALVREGASIRRIAATLNSSQGAVRHWLVRYGLETMRTERRREISRAKARGAEVVLFTCPCHGPTEFRLAPSGRYFCPQCRSDAVSRRRRRVKEILIAEGGGACRLCGYSGYAGALQFHHLDPSIKEFSVSKEGGTLSLARTRSEASKCVLLCANCHAEVEAGLKEVA